MRADHSWDGPAARYEAAYAAVIDEAAAADLPERRPARGRGYSRTRIASSSAPALRVVMLDDVLPLARGPDANTMRRGRVEVLDRSTVAAGWPSMVTLSLPRPGPRGATSATPLTGEGECRGRSRSARLPDAAARGAGTRARSARNPSNGPEGWMSRVPGVGW